MADNPKFLTTLKAVDEVTGPISSILKKLKVLGHATQGDFANPWKKAMGDAERAPALGALSAHVQALKGHLHGLGSLAGAALGSELHHAGEEVEHVGHKAKDAGEEVRHLGHHARDTGEEIKKSAHPHGY